MKNFYLILIFLLVIAPANAFNDVVLPQSGYGASNNLIINEVITNEDFENLEKIIFKKTYPSDSAQKRLSRLEKEVFGMEQNGDTKKDYEERMENLYTAAQYYNEGYRNGESTKEHKQNEKYYTYEKPSQPVAKPQQSSEKLNAWNYIRDYDYNQIPGYSEKEAKRLSAEYENLNSNQTKYYNAEDYELPESQLKQPLQKQSKIKQFFQDLADALTAGVVTGYTPPMTTNPGYYDTFTDFGGSNYIGPSIYSSYPYQARRYNPHYYAPQRYYGSPYYGRNYAPPVNSYNHTGQNPALRNHPHNRPHNSYSRPYAPGAGNIRTGAGVRIIN